MPKPRQLSNPPITEAVIDLRVKPTPGFQLEQLDPVLRAIEKEYSRRDEILMREFLVAVQPDAENMASRRRGPIGFRLRSADEKRVVQVRANGFTFSWLKPYPGWQDVRAAALGIWTIYSEHVRPQAAVRTAVRYINHIPLTLPIDDIREFFPATPDLPDEWPQVMTGFLSRVAVVDEGTGDQAIVTQTVERDAEVTAITFLLDIDCYNTTSFPDSPAIWETLDRLRVLKNRIFFSSITDQLVDRFA